MTEKSDSWKDHAVEVYCSNHECPEKIILDERKIDGLIVCSNPCALILVLDLKSKEDA